MYCVYECRVGHVLGDVCGIVVQTCVCAQVHGEVMGLLLSGSNGSFSQSYAVPLWLQQPQMCML